MFSGNVHTVISKTTSYKVVLPFYVYAGLAFLVATVLLLVSTSGIVSHYFHPHTLALTHIMALGWGTMMILGASHQLVPVLVEGALYSRLLAFASFIIAAIGIPLLVYGFYVFNMGWPAQWGGGSIIVAIIFYLVNIGASIAKNKNENVHAVFVFTSALWLLATAIVGFLLVINFNIPVLPKNSLVYLSLHAHLGIAGWFLLLITGVGSRLIPMFLISKYNNPRQLWWIYGLINGGLLTFIFLFLFTQGGVLMLFPLFAITLAILLFGNFCYGAYQLRIRKKVDDQVRVSLLSVAMMLLPLIFLGVIIFLLVLTPGENIRLMLAYGFIIFFGWITAIILGMTFKTVPFIVWNKVYHQLDGKGKTPNPKELFSDTIFRWMSLFFIAGFVIFSAGILLNVIIILKAGAVLLLATSVLYNWNLVKVLMHKPVL